MDHNEFQSIFDMAMGALQERANVVANQIFANIQDPNTKAEKKRQMVITIEFVPDAERRSIRTESVIVPKLVPTNAIATTFCLGKDGNGKPIAAEMTSRIPGQIHMDGTEQKPGIVIPITKAQ